MNRWMGAGGAWRLTLGGLVLGAVTATAAPAVTNGPARWEKDIQAFERADATNPPPAGAVLFIGSSSIRMWKTLAADFPEVKVINRGFGGSTIADSVYYADRIVAPYKPAVIVLGAGSNDLHAGKKPEQVFADLQAFVTKVRAALPGVRFLVYAVNPAPSRWAEADRQREANRLFKDYADREADVEYIDIFTPFLGADGPPRAELYVADRLHQNAAGYQVRTTATLPFLSPMAASK